MRQRSIADPDGPHGLLGDLLRFRCYEDHRLADEADPILGQQGLVLSNTAKAIEAGDISG
jgi:hypothetical protein